MSESYIAKTVFIVAGLTLVTASTAFGGIETFPIARGAGDQQYPAIDDCTVAWQDNRSGDWDISVADITHLGGINPRTFVDVLTDAQYPAVSGDIVVWQSKFFLYEDWDIIGLDVPTETFFDVAVTYADECRPAISGDLVVAEIRTTQRTDWNIVGIDISYRGEPYAFWIDVSPENQWRPDLDGDILVYQDTLDGMPYLSGWDLSDLGNREWFPIYGQVGARLSPAVYGKWVVWQESVEGVSTVTGDNIFHPDRVRSLEPDDVAESLNPDVYNNVVVWQDYREDNWDIYAHNLTTKETFPITSHPADQTHPAITFSPWLNGYVVVWQDRRDGNWDIYGALIKGPEVAGCVSPLKGDVNIDSVVDAEDVDEVEDRLGERNGIPADGN
jgi:beta propeller repeat protein